MTGIIDRQIKAYRRANRRYRKRIELFSERTSECIQPESPDLRLDLERALLRLLPRDRQICQALSLGESVKDIAERLNYDRATIELAFTRIRKTFESAGLQAWLDPNWEGEKDSEKADEKKEQKR